MLLRRIYTALALVILVHSASCDRIKNKGRQAKEQAKEMAGAAIDNVFTKYDPFKPDTRDNKACYESYLSMKPTKDVSNIYAYGDFLGIDYKVVMAFTCGGLTVDSIVTMNGMKRATERGGGLMFSEEFSWWKEGKILQLTPYKVGAEGEHWQYLWYDSTTREAFYESYSL